MIERIKRPKHVGEHVVVRIRPEYRAEPADKSAIWMLGVIAPEPSRGSRPRQRPAGQESGDAPLNLGRGARAPGVLGLLGSNLCLVAARATGFAMRSFGASGRMLLRASFLLPG